MSCHEAPPSVVRNVVCGWWTALLRLRSLGGPSPGVGCAPCPPCSALKPSVPEAPGSATSTGCPKMSSGSTTYTGQPSAATVLSCGAGHENASAYPPAASPVGTRSRRHAPPARRTDVRKPLGRTLTSPEPPPSPAVEGPGFEDG